MKVLFGFIFTVTLLASFPVTPQVRPRAQEIRAVWVTRWEYRTPEDVERIFQNLSAFHFNTVLFQVRGNATAFYDSDIEPRAEELVGLPADWDPLALAATLAREKQLSLHVWINVGPGWRGRHAPDVFNQLWNTHPEWFARDQMGNHQRLNSHYVWLALTQPEVREYLAGVVREIVEKYRPDGVHFDYIRFPGPGLSYDPVSLQLFLRQTGGRPRDYPDAWNAFRRQAIADFVSLVRDSLAAIGAKPLLSAAVWRNPVVGRNLFMQDSHMLLKKGLLDLLFPMIYTAEPMLFRHELSLHLADVPADRLVAGIHPSERPETLEEIEISRNMKIAGQSIFSYSALFPDHRAGSVARALKKQYYRRPVEPEFSKSRAEFIQFDDIFTWPRVVRQKMPFYLFARLASSGGRPAPVPGLFVEWKNPIPQVDMVPLPHQPGLFVSKHPILLSDFEQWLEFRLVAVDTVTRSDSAFSCWQHIPVAGSTWAPESATLIGPLIGGAQFITADARGNLWIPAWWDNKIYVLRPDGSQLPFSPISFGLDATGQALRIYRPAGITSLHGDTVVVAGHAEKKVLLRFLAENGTPLPGMALPFVPYDVDASAIGELFVTEANSGNWYHFMPGKQDSASFLPVPGGHFLRGIAVSPDGLTVYATCQAEGTVHQWQRLNALASFSPVPDFDVEALSIGCVDTDRFGHVYVSHTAGGFVTVFNRDGVLIHVLRPDSPLLQAPRGVAATPQGLFITQMGATTALQIMRLFPPLPEPSH